jgi:hypothetical protein
MAFGRFTTFPEGETQESAPTNANQRLCVQLVHFNQRFAFAGGALCVFSASRKTVVKPMFSPIAFIRVIRGLFFTQKDSWKDDMRGGCTVLHSPGTAESLEIMSAREQSPLEAMSMTS